MMAKINGYVVYEGPSIAEGYRCESCGHHEVYGAEQLLLGIA